MAPLSEIICLRVTGKLSITPSPSFVYIFLCLLIRYPDAMEASKVYSHVLGPTSVVASIICGLAVISNYCFPKQRKFPNVVLVWTWYARPSMLSQLDSFSLIIIPTNKILIFYPVYFYILVWWIWCFQFTWQCGG